MNLLFMVSLWSKSFVEKKKLRFSSTKPSLDVKKDTFEWILFLAAKKLRLESPLSMTISQTFLATVTFGIFLASFFHVTWNWPFQFPSFYDVRNVINSSSKLKTHQLLNNIQSVNMFPILILIRILILILILILIRLPAFF